ncbi:hypothetical protein, partial [Burkholderia cenocepacia]|uniref:hypothetical protein n=1 Tax=Burkholderia cenocepacia TaxID=95486 RepID=UPI0024B6E066
NARRRARGNPPRGVSNDFVDDSLSQLVAGAHDERSTSFAARSLGRHHAGLDAVPFGPAIALTALTAG